MSKEIQITEQNKYSTKDITAWVRNKLKNTFPDLKFSVSFESYSGGSNMKVYLMESKTVRFIKTKEEITEEDIHKNMAGYRTFEESREMLYYELGRTYQQVNHYYIESDPILTETGRKILVQIKDIAQHYNYDHSDSMTDYFDVNYYLSMGLGKWDKPFIDGTMR